MLGAEATGSRCCRSPTSTRRRRSKRSVGERGGVVCTSSNAAATLKWAWERGERFCSCPISISAATPRTRWACRSTTWCVWDPNEIWGGLEPRRGQARADASCGRATARCTRASPCARSRTSARSIPACASSCIRRCRGTSCRRPTTPDRPNTSSRQVKDSPAGSDLGRRHRNPPRQSAGASRWRPTGPCCRSISSAASARPCSASRRIICCGFSKACGRRGPQPHRRSRRPETLDQGRAGSHVVDCRLSGR